MTYMTFLASKQSAFITGVFHYFLLAGSLYVSEHVQLPDILVVIGLLFVISALSITGLIWVSGIFNSADDIAKGNLLRTRLSDFKQTIIHCACWLCGSGGAMKLTLFLVN
ncbi:hypothetical protein [Pseudoalteromonas viridis]|uniref:Uncharacterized protein n=1 Tax=Pseudoalteromonas viridis TaxID=339617 RepID=A0ABX7VCW5_9GAMM|nr:hypothetical protein [Pseudoalteromonas viridis]QTL37085.1 hypothetical protein J5X90_08700 [Pseudoalteromonas viridis]